MQNHIPGAQPLSHKKKYTFTLWMVAVICLTAALNNYEWTLSGNTLTLERVMALPLFLIALVFFLVKRKRIKKSSPSLVLLVWLIIALVSSMASNVAEWAMKMFVAQVLAAAFYYLIIWLRPEPEVIIKSRLFLIVAFFMGPFLSLTYLASTSGMVLPDFMAHWLQEGSGGTRVRATIAEANLFGVFVSFVILAMFALNKKNKPWWWLLLAGLHLSLVFSFSRIPWVAYIVSAAIYFSILSPRPYNLRRILSLSITSIFALVGLIVVAVIIFYEFGDSEIIGRTHSLNTRLVMWRLAINSIIENPIIGNGVYSFSALYSFAPELVGSDSHRSAWISNIFLAILHDTGIVGLALFIYFYYAILKTGFKHARKQVLSGAGLSSSTRICAALTAFAISLIISGLSIPAYSLAFFWISIALLEVSCSTGSNKERV